MAEACAIVGLVASIASLVDISAKLVLRLHEFISKSSNVPNSFRSLSGRLPLLSVTLQRIQSQAEGGLFRDNVTKALKLVIDDTFDQVSAIQRCLSMILPPDGASKLERASKALISLAKEDKVQQAVDKIDKNNNILVLHQTTQHLDTGNLILARLPGLNMISEPALGSFEKDKLLPLARDDRTLSLHARLMLSNSNRGLLFRFSQLPIAVQERFMAQQEEQLSQLVEQEEAKALNFFNAFDTREYLEDYGRHRVEGSCDWILQDCEFLEWIQGKCNRLWLLGGLATGKTVLSAFITKALDDRLGNEDILAVYKCSLMDSQTRSPKSILCSLAGQIGRNSLASMEKCKKFLEKYTLDGKLKAEILDLQDLIVEMSLSSEIRRIFIVIDGFDEADWEQSDLLMAIVDIPQRARKVKMLIASRQNSLIAKALQGYSTLSLHNLTLDDSLRKFIDREFQRSDLKDMPLQDLDEMKERVIRTCNGVNGTFFYARMIIHTMLLEWYENALEFQRLEESLLQWSAQMRGGTLVSVSAEVKS